MRTFLVITVVLVAFTQVVWADVGLTAEDLLSKDKQYRVSMSVLYANSNDVAVSADGFFLDSYYLGEFAIPVVPIVYDVNRTYTYSDFFAVSTGLRYGYNERSEIYISVSGSHSESREEVRSVHTSSFFERTHSAQLDSVTFGITRRLIYEGRHPEVLWHLDTTGDYQGRDAWFWARSWHTGVTLYRTYDPLLLSMAVGYRLLRSRDIPGRGRYYPSDVLYLSPDVVFAVNNDVSLSAGLVLNVRQKNRIYRDVTTPRRTTIALNMELAFAKSAKATFSLGARFNAGRSSGAQVFFSMLRKFQPGKERVEKKLSLLRRKKLKEDKEDATSDKTVAPDATNKEAEVTEEGSQDES